uniref:Uncharacterized protein n=1 Tax=Pristionchus pacificus TaxID=54126 RepID=A0A2A6BH63_PRIPA|eukprot:PDM65227.1 hypothetical protein PRIPAC_52169 [Pristionchus pacificus]
MEVRRQEDDSIFLFRDARDALTLCTRSIPEKNILNIYLGSLTDPQIRADASTSHASRADER